MSHSHKRPTAKRQPKSKFERYYWIGGVALIVGLIIVLTLQFTNQDFVPKVEGAPSIEVKQSVIDHGTIEVNRQITSAFEVRNVGDEYLYFTDQPYVEVIEGCCPPQVQVSKESLKPGETGVVQMTYTMHEGMDGPHEFRVHVSTNDPAQPETLLTVYSNWVP